MKIAVMQLNSDADVTRNLARILDAMGEAVATNAPNIIALPEYALCLTGDREAARRNAQDLCNSTPLQELSDFAKHHRTAIHLGSIVERATDGRYFNTTVVFGETGQVIARYRKRNLFRSVHPDLRESVVHNEADFLAPGDALSVFKMGGRTFGNAICYDLRFPDLFRALADNGASIIFAPSAFTAMTGKSDWRNLLQARAKETKSYIVAANQCGFFDSGRYESWGHSMVVGPHGDLLTQAQDRPCAIFSDV